jgi:Tol biopolymer transport system component
MAMRLVLVFAIAVVLSGGGIASAAPRYSEWSAPQNLGAVLNTSFNDDGPGLSRDGRSLYFTSTRPGFGTEDIWVSQRPSADAPWGAPQNLGPVINTAAQERVPNFSRDGHWMFFGSSRSEGSFGGFDLWASWRQNVHDDFGWQAPANLGPGINTALTENAPAFLETEDGAQSIYFTRNKAPGSGDFDLFVSARQADGSWATATPIVELNTTPFNESRPAIRHDGLELFFQSNRTGSTALDLWSATRAAVADAWSAPENLRALNSVVVDSQPTISSDGETLIFASNRPGFGGNDLYVSTRTKVHGKP